MNKDKRKYGVKLEFPKKLENHMNTLQKEIKKAAQLSSAKILKSCEKLTFEMPKDQMAFTVNSEPFIYLNIKQQACHELGLANLNKTQLQNKYERLEQDVTTTLNHIAIGKRLFEKQFSLSSEFLPNAYFLLYLELEASPKLAPSEIYKSYYILALHLIAEYEVGRLSSFGTEKEFQSLPKALDLTKKSASAHEYLLLAQKALQLGDSSKRAAQLGLDRDNEERDFAIIHELALKSKKAQDRLHMGTKSRTKNAVEKWQPLLIEVQVLVREGKTIANACQIVANRHTDVNAELLRQAYYRHSDLL